MGWELVVVMQKRLVEVFGLVVNGSMFLKVRRGALGGSVQVYGATTADLGAESLSFPALNSLEGRK